MDKAKPFDISKAIVWKAFQLVKVNNGSAGIDQQSIENFELDLSKNLYKLWNRLSSGTYFPPAVKGVAIPKKQGGIRMLGIPTVADRIAQMAIKLAFEPYVEPMFLEDSYGYRPNKSALDAIGIARKRCWEYNWVLEFDIKGLFDNINHELLMVAVRKHTENKWILLYIERWLKASMHMPDGTIINRMCGTPQGGVISPVLSNLFLHYVFDAWMAVYHKGIKWCRYADDGIAHCKTEAEAQALLVELKNRFEECKLELHPDKTKIIYCKDHKRTGEYSNTRFKFLGYDFQGRPVKGQYSMFMGFTPAVSKDAKKQMTTTLRKLSVRSRTDLEIWQIAKMINPVMSGWINYYGKYYKSAMFSVCRCLNSALARWARRKYKKLKTHRTLANQFIKRIAKEKPNLFVHWKLTDGFI